MAIRVALTHKTTYRYDRRVQLTPQIVRLRPAPHCRTKVLSYALHIHPDGHFLNWQQDPQSNWLARVVFPEKVDHLSLGVDLVAELSVINPFDFFLEPDAEEIPFTYPEWLEQELAPFRRTQQNGARFESFLQTVDRRPRRTIDFLVDLNQRLSEEIQYLIRMEPGVQTCEETLRNGSGSCRDTAWLLVQLLRRLGFAARFVSGYLIQLKPDVKPLEGPAGAAEDFTDLHAWVEVYVAGAGWIGLDPTSGLLAAEGHLPLAATPEPASAAPLSGGVEDCEVAFEFDMRIERIHEDPRVTLPYDDPTWERIDALGEHVDQVLQDGDVRLTMGGEPTFVSIDDMDGPEWTTGALGESKRRLGESLLRRMTARMAPGGLLHFGQGKWYPGEPLPRWALTCYWRADGAPIWHDPERIADGAKPGPNEPRDALDFAQRLAERLEVNAECALPAYEDPWPALRAEGQLPVNVDPADNRLDDPVARAQLRRVFERGLSTPVGSVLPLQRVPGKRGPEWQTSLWLLRGRHLTLVPGDSPMGLRLPLERLPWEPPSMRPYTEPLDPLQPRGPLPMPMRPGNRGLHPPQRLEPTRRSSGAPKHEAPEERASEVDLLDEHRAPVRTALCVECREGRLHIFMPPLDSVEDYLDLLSQIEATAIDQDVAVVIEGYPMPFDARVERMSVTPDPGVLEVNVRPVASWSALVAETTALYEDARQTRLGTEKFMLDGRHSGTGGGNHVVLGGSTPADSPFLRRPDLLRSLVGYWLDHPALSYLFSGLFVGPTSQAPRIDEARHESVYELEIAFEQIPEPGGDPPPPWLVDRIFRNLLTDVTGNTHRAEFCIDKLYSPDSSTGRLGLLELRAFEMPPHPRMSLVQQLLLRACVAWFWNEPYGRRPMRWGTQLHDRFMLPWFIDQDLRSVLADLSAAGFAFDRRWFDSHFEFRFPKIGTRVHEGVEIELRHAIEPWHVMGEEGAVGGTVRYVDSSLERVQVLVRGLPDPERLIPTCNGRRLPLHPTGVQGEWVAGVRFRAWQPPSCLHPTIGVHSPLVFDLVDPHARRSMAGCTFRVSHPGGRNYDTFPVNAYEAEARRAAHFEPFGHTFGTVAIPRAERNPQFPLTLDLRRAGA